jgi:hypothetical protein
VAEARERSLPRERRPFGSASRGAGRSTEHTGPDCWVCAEGRRRDAARGDVQLAAPDGREIVRAAGYNHDGKMGNYNPMAYR